MELDQLVTALPQTIAGRNPTTSRRALLMAAVLAAALGVFWAAQSVLGVSVYGAGPFDVIRHGLVLLTLLAAVRAYANDGLLVCWALVGLPIAATVLTGPGVGITTGDEFGPLRRLGFAVGGGVVGALTLGTAGFVVGSTLARLRTRLGESQHGSGD